MDKMREGINLRAYGQKNPLIEYKKEGYILFEEMMFYINKEILKNIFRTNLTKVDESKIIVESNVPKNIKLSHNKNLGLNLPNTKRQQTAPSPVSNSNPINKKSSKEDTKLTLVETIEELGFIPSLDNSDETNVA